ncbi:MAG: flagellar basal body P-ring formation protein FlgA [Deltaproteobacteria bacterium]|nr:flagellar basal body P-ring formation protein FlgA [Deltaproteobacteria bacterium]
MSFFKLNIKPILFSVIGIILVQQVWLNGLFAGDGKILEPDIKISVKETSLIKNSHVFLKDIARISANGFLKEALGKIELGSSPKPGKIKSFDKRKLLSALRAQRYLPENIIIESPDRIYVKRQSQVITKKDIRQFVENSLLYIFRDKEYQLTRFNVHGLEPYPPGKIRLWSDPNHMVDKNGRLSFLLDVIIDGAKVDRVSVSGAMAVYENVIHTTKAYAKGETISKENVYYEKDNVLTLGDNFIKAFGEIDGKILKSGVRKGDYLKLRNFTDPPMVHKGDIVTLVAKSDTLLITTSAISKEDGAKNEMIKVENLNSGKLVRGIVKGKSKVEVVF